MGTAANVRVGVTGAVYSAPTGTPLPTDAEATLNVAFHDLGYISDDGVVEGISTDSTKIKAWGGDTVREVQTSHDVTYKFTMLETTDETQQIYYGSASGGVVEVTSAQGERGEWVVQVIDGDQLIRIVIPDGQVTDRGDVTYHTDDATGYEVTITAYPDESGVKAYKYIVDSGS